MIKTGLLLLFIKVIILFAKQDCPREKLGDFHYTVENSLVEPNFDTTIKLSVRGCNETLKTYMEQAVDEYPDLFKNFSIKYHPNIGFEVYAFNGITAHGSNMRWELTDIAHGNKDICTDPRTCTGYIPKPEDHVAWNLTLDHSVP